MSIPPGVFLALREPEDARFYPSVIPVQSFAPPISARVWLDDSVQPAQFKAWNGAAWVAIDGTSVAEPAIALDTDGVPYIDAIGFPSTGSNDASVAAAIGSGTTTDTALSSYIAGEVGTPSDTRTALETHGDARWQRDLDVTQYGAVGDGVANDTAAIQAAITASMTGDRRVFLPKGTYKVTSTITVPDEVSLRGAGRGLTRIVSTQTSNPIVSISGTLASAVSLTANAAVGATSITVSSTAGFAAGDVLLLSDNTIPDSTQPTRKSGELVQVASVTSGTVLALAAGATSGAVRGTFVGLGDLTGYTTAQSATVRRVDMASGALVADMTLQGNTAGFGSAGAVALTYAKGAHLSGLEILDLGGSGITIRSSLGVQVSDCWVHDLIDDTANGRYGYGINITGASSLVTVTGCVFERMRHAVTTNGEDAGGIPDNITVSGCRADGTHNSSFDTHAAGMNVTFADCTSTDSLYGFSVRARQVTLRDCEAVRPSSDGLVFWEVARHTVVSGLLVRDAGRYGVNAESGSDLHLEDVTVLRSSSHGIRIVPGVGFGDRVKVSRPRVYDVGTGGSGSIGVFINASGRVGIEVVGGLFVNTGALAYRSAVDITAASGAIIAGNRAINLGFASAGMIVDAGTSTLLFDNISVDNVTQDARASLPTATTANLTSATHRINLAKRAGMVVFNTTTSKPVYATGSTATSTWVDATGATAHTPA